MTSPTRYAEACERAAAICYLTAGPPEYRSGMAHRMVTDAEDLRALAQALREAKAWAEWLPKPDNAPKVYALTLPTETGA